MESFTEEMNFSDDYEAERNLERRILIISRLIGAVGFLENLFVIVKVMIDSSKRDSTRLLILSLSTSDSIFGFFCITFAASDFIVGRWPFGLRLCEALQYLIAASAYISTYNLVLISMNRFLSICYPVSRLREM